jgi:DNA-binding transcriptional regulator YiaG
MTPNELKAARKVLGLSAAKMGQALEVDPRTVRRWEAGPQAVPGPVKVAVGFMLKYGPDDLP